MKKLTTKILSLILTLSMIMGTSTTAFAQSLYTQDVKSGIVINGEYYTDEEFQELLRYIEPGDEKTPTIMPRMAIGAAIPAWALGKWLIPVAGTMVTVYVTPTLIKVGNEIVDNTSKTFNNILDAIKQAKKSKESGKEKANDVPSWAKGERPKPGESGKDFAKRLCDKKFGKGNYKKGPGSDYNKLKKWGDRGFK